MSEILAPGPERTLAGIEDLAARPFGFGAMQIHDDLIHGLAEHLGTGRPRDIKGDEHLRDVVFVALLAYLVGRLAARDHSGQEVKQQRETSSLPVSDGQEPPGILDRSVIDHIVCMDDTPAYVMTKRLFREEGLIVGPSTGAIVHAAMEFGRDREGVGVAISPDSGLKYTSFFADILGDEGNPRLWR